MTTRWLMLWLAISAAGGGCRLAERPPTPPATGSLRLVFAGDTHFGENYFATDGGDNIPLTRGYDYSLAKLAPLLEDADLAIVNLETPAAETWSSPFEGRKGYLHWTRPERALPALRRCGVDAVSLANNHALDGGLRALSQSLSALASHDLVAFGAGVNESAAARALRRDFLLGERRFRVIVAAGFEYRPEYDRSYDFYARGQHGGVNLWTPARATAQLRALRRAEPDAFIVAFPHWGKNYAWRTAAQKALGHALVEAGADIVLGHGAHALQEIEAYRGRWIVYGLGNFIFNSYGRYDRPGATPYSLVARVEVPSEGAPSDGTSQGAPVLELIPIVSDNRRTTFRPRPVSAAEAGNVRDLLLAHSPDAEGLRKALRTDLRAAAVVLTLPLTPGAAETAD
jgi:hypothetical protein